jgi:hypothetical protein
VSSIKVRPEPLSGWTRGSRFAVTASKSLVGAADEYTQSQWMAVGSGGGCLDEVQLDTLVKIFRDRCTSSRVLL